MRLRAHDHLRAVAFVRRKQQDAAQIKNGQWRALYLYLLKH
jgi:hypothetical protein